MTKAATAASVDLPYEPDEVLPPGETLRETLEALDMSQSQLAQRTGLSTKHINQIIQGQSALTHETALILERATGVPARLWNSLEAHFRDHAARAQERIELTAKKDWLAQMPVAQLRRLGFVTSTARDAGAQLQEVLQFFGVATVEAWSAVWAKPAASFLQSAAFEAEAGAVAAWLRLGEVAAALVECEPYDRAALRSMLPQLRALTTQRPHEFWPEIQALCASVGVAVVLVAEVKGARASGATRWISPSKAIVQLSNRGKKNDRFWFAFFHEIGHVLLHGKRDVFVEHNIGVDGGRPQQEREANDFAGRLLIPKEYEGALATLYREDEIVRFAQSIGVAPGIVAGRIRHDRAINDPGVYRLYNALFETYELVDETD